MTAPPRTLCSQLPTAAPGTAVTLEGWVHRRRELARITFVVVRDRSGFAQVVLPAGTPVPPEETTIRVTGTATANEQAPGGVEVTDAVLEPLTEPAETSPAELWRPSLDVSLPTLLDHAPVLWRHPAQRARWQLAAASLRGFRSTLDGLGFTEVTTPKVVGTATESGANVFPVDWFGRPAYLAQSPQFYKQQLVGVFERVYEVGPVFRAEPHDTVRHLAEYRSLDVELGFIRDHREVLAVLRDVLAGMVAAAASEEASVASAGASLPVVPDEIPVIHFADALALVGAPADEPDLAPEHERALGAWALAEHGSDFLAVEGYPMAKRPFYTHPWSRDGPERLVDRRRRRRSGRTPSTCSSAGWSWSREASGCTGRRTTSARSARAARTRRRTTPTCRRSGTGCRRTAGSPSVSSGGSAGSSSGQHPRGHALPARPEPAGRRRSTRRRRRGWCRSPCRWGCRSC